MSLVPSLVVGFPGSMSAEENESWVLREHDCELPSQYWLVTESTDVYRSAPSSDRIHFKAGWGTKILVSQTIEPSYVISELQPRIWVRSTKSNIQMFVRVVLPHTNDPTDGKPMTALIPGPILRDADQWRKLDFADEQQTLPEKLEEAVWKLRSRFAGTPIDKRDAYVDMIVLNLFASAGSCTVWTDDLEVPGAVGARQVAEKQSVPRIDNKILRTGYSQDIENKQPAIAQVNGTIVEIRGNPFFASIIQHNGEPFEFLQSLGFNTVELKQTATYQQLQHAASLDMWIICPPPSSIGLEPIDRQYDRVLAWSLGNELTPRDLENVRATKQEIEKSDFRSDRPLVAFTKSSVPEFARLSNILGVGFQPVGGSFRLEDYGQWIEQRARIAHRTIPIWASIQSEMLPTIQSQSSVLAQRVPPMPLAAEQIKLLSYQAIRGGARGMRFLSASRLDSEDPAARLRSTTLHWVNAHLDQLQPWISGGAVVDRTADITTLRTERSKLKLVHRSTDGEHWSVGSTSVGKFVISDPSMTPSEQAYMITENGLVPLEQGRAVSRSDINIEKCGSTAAVVITQEPLVINSLADSYLRSTRNQSEMHLEISRQWLTICQLINGQMVRLGRTIPEASGSINEANTLLRQAQSLMSNGSVMTANPILMDADQKLSVARRAFMADARGQFASTTSTPMLSHVSLTPLHFELIGRIDPRLWSPNGLAGGDFENLQQMTSNGWENQVSGQGIWKTNVELSNVAKVDGNRSLMLSVSDEPSSQRDAVVDETPLWIDSAPVPVKAGQLVRIHGWVKIDRPIRGSLDGLMIVDSIGGTEVAERIRATNGWQEFTLYRGAQRNQDVRVTFALTGIGTIYVDEVTIRAVALPRANLGAVDETIGR